jgi:hypothetical protein
MVVEGSSARAQNPENRQDINSYCHSYDECVKDGMALTEDASWRKLSLDLLPHSSGSARNKFHALTSDKDWHLRSLMRVLKSVSIDNHVITHRDDTDLSLLG